MNNPNMPTGKKEGKKANPQNTIALNLQLLACVLASLASLLGQEVCEDLLEAVCIIDGTTDGDLLWWMLGRTPP